MLRDIERWNRKYGDGNPNPDFAPDPVLKNHAQLLDGKGTALDLACGVGHNAIFLAERGYDVIAIDGSVVGLSYCRNITRHRDLRLSLIAADLERITLPRDYFDVVVVFRYLYRPLIAPIKMAVKPGGLIVYATFNKNLLLEKPNFSKEYLLKHGELNEWFSGFHRIATNDTPELQDSLTYFVGRKPLVAP